MTIGSHYDFYYNILYGLTINAAVYHVYVTIDVYLWDHVTT